MYDQQLAFHSNDQHCSCMNSYDQWSLRSTVWCVYSVQKWRSLFLGRFWVYQRPDCCPMTVQPHRMLEIWWRCPTDQLFFQLYPNTTGCFPLNLDIWICFFAQFVFLAAKLFTFPCFKAIMLGGKRLVVLKLNKKWSVGNCHPISNILWGCTVMGQQSDLW